MPKVKWGGGITEEDINSAETNQFEPYDGPMPPRGVYGWQIKSMKKGKSSTDNDRISVTLVLVPRRDRPEDKRYEGYPQMAFIPVMKSTAWRVRPLLDVLGVTYRQFITQTVVDEDGNITKIGTVTPVGKYLRAEIRINPNNDQYMEVMGWYDAKSPEPASKTTAAAKKAAPARRREPEPEPDEDTDDGEGYTEDDSAEEAPF